MMNEISVISGEQILNGEKIRYIKLNNQNYLIYSLNEKDEEGYEKLYINKIIDNEEDLITEPEWEELKRNIPVIVKEIKSNNITNFSDLDMTNIKRGNLKYARAFKLKVNIVDSIKNRQEVDIHSEINNLLNELNSQEKSINELDNFLERIESNNVEVPVNPDNRYEIEYEKMKEELESTKQENEQLQTKIIDLQNEINKYKNKLEKIKIMIEQS